MRKPRLSTIALVVFVALAIALTVVFSRQLADRTHDQEDALKVARADRAHLIEIVGTQQDALDFAEEVA